MDDIMNILKIDRKRADEIAVMCYDKIAKVKAAKRGTGQVGEVINFMKDVGDNDIEHYYAGFIMGRIAQVHSIVQNGIEPALESELASIEQAEFKQSLEKHPEFG